MCPIIKGISLLQLLNSCGILNCYNLLFLTHMAYNVNVKYLLQEFSRSILFLGIMNPIKVLQVYCALTLLNNGLVYCNKASIGAYIWRVFKFGYFSLD